MKNKLVVFLIAILVLIGFTADSALAVAPYSPTVGDIIKTSANPAVYLIGDDYKRHLYVNAATFWTWYTGSWANIKFGTTTKSIKIISQEDFDNLTTGSNVTAQAGMNLIRFPNSSRIYTVVNGNKLALVSGTSTAQSLFGSNWANKIITIQESFENDYTKDGILDNGLKNAKGWLEGTINPLNLTLAETDVSGSDRTGSKYSLILSSNSVCSNAETGSSYICTASSEKWPSIGDRVRVYGYINDNKIIVNKLEVVSSLPLSQW